MRSSSEVRNCDGVIRGSRHIGIVNNFTVLANVWEYQPELDEMYQHLPVSKYGWKGHSTQYSILQLVYVFRFYVLLISYKWYHKRNWGKYMCPPIKSLTLFTIIAPLLPVSGLHNHRFYGFRLHYVTH